MITSRRDFIAGSSTALAVSNLPGRALAHDSADSAVEALLAEFAEELLVDYPENATGLGVDKGKRAGLKSKLADRSPDGQRAIAQRAGKRLERLKAIDPSGAPGAYGGPGTIDGKVPGRFWINLQTTSRHSGSQLPTGQVSRK